VDKLIPSDDLTAVWKEIAANMKTEVSADTFQRWFKDIKLVELGAHCAHAPRAKQYLSAVDRE
jgi:hypothetical protein